MAVLYSGAPVMHPGAVPSSAPSPLSVASLIHGILSAGSPIHSFGGPPGSPIGGVTVERQGVDGGIHPPGFGGPVFNGQPGIPSSGAPAPGILDGFFQHFLGGLPQHHGSLAAYLEHPTPSPMIPHQGPLMAPEHAVHVAQQNVLAHLLQAIQNINRAQNPGPGLPPREVAIQ